MKIINSCVCVLPALILLLGCSPQPSEVQKIAIEKEMIGCLFAVNETMGEDDSPLVDVFLALGKLADSPSFENKKWSLDTDEASQKDTVTVQFKNEETLFSCSFASDSDGMYEIRTVSRNSQEVFNKDENERIKKEKAALKERQRVEQIKQWHEKGYADASYKYFEKRHVNSKSSFGDPTLKVVCHPKRLRVEFDNGKFTFNGRENVEFLFNQDGNSVKKKFDLTSSGTVGIKKQSAWSDVAYDKNKTHAFLDLLETSTSVIVEDSTFNVDDYKQIPCLKSRKEDLAKEAEAEQVRLEKIKAEEQQKQLEEEARRSAEMERAKIARAERKRLLAEKIKRELEEKMKPRASWINPISTPKPKHPLLALESGVDGMALVRFTLLRNGKISNPLLLEEWPEGYDFGKSAIEASYELEYENRKTPIQGVIYKFIFKQDEKN